jgi:Na+-transporting methylmalonyl-CoA/oxaloacetate decarboxylase gamma subunit
MENLGFGLQITAYGMGLVFGLLALLWGLLALTARLDRPPVAPILEEQESREPPPALAISARDGRQIAPETLAAITVAVLAHREARRRQAAPAMRSSWPGSLLYASKWVAAGRTRQQQSWRRGR